MFAVRFFVLTLVSVACASKLEVRQTTNTNAAINSIVDVILSDVAPNRVYRHPQATPISAGSTTITPTNDDISITYSDAVVLIATSLSGVIATGAVPDFSSMVASFDPILAATTNQLNITSPNSVALVHIMLLDASQFFTDEGFTQTLAALGF
ncbi:POXA3a laccase small subunit [Mycena maculata]|uniref:POXA3a laccase small subunit n=1 Tax=Mycena maculata TaxID=230809 RepID=A0AAD7JCD2_9AGAR|nr:POXA3a laccase small subunit [Mycena maculata]